MVDKKVKKIIAAFVIGGILLGSGTSVNAFAGTRGASAFKKIAGNFKMPGHKAVSSDEMVKNMKEKLDSLVKANTITQDQEDKILAYTKTKYDERTAEMEKVKNMTESEKKAYFENKAKSRSDMLRELVSSKVISQTQADAIKKAIGHNGFKGEKDFNGKINRMKNNLDTAVKEGTITQVQEDKILAYMNQRKENRKVEMEKVKAMTEAERKAYFESKDKTVKTDMFSELVNAGIINQSQADKLKSMMPACPKGQGFKKNSNTKPNN